MIKKEVELVVVSDIHLGTYGSHAKELLRYLRSVRSGTLILNGDIILTTASAIFTSYQ
jgi:UDP-2,3-diacylglucosamine pyrophosphatase LpxH